MGLIDDDDVDEWVVKGAKEKKAGALNDSIHIFYGQTIFRSVNVVPIAIIDNLFTYTTHPHFIHLSSKRHIVVMFQLWSLFHLTSTAPSAKRNGTLLCHPFKRGLSVTDMHGID